ncbi:MAG: DUF4199 domain-containing protein [Bacteroidales bacterium]
MEKRNKWKIGSKYALYLSLVTIIIETIIVLLLNYSPASAGKYNWILNLVKLAGCLYLLHYFMKQYTLGKEYVSNKDLFGFGTIISFLSAIVCIVFSEILLLIIFPDFIPQQIENYLQMMQNMGTPGVELLDYDKIVNAIPMYLAFGKLISCMFWGLIFSAIFSSFLKKDNLLNSPSDTDNDTDTDNNDNQDYLNN